MACELSVDRQILCVKGNRLENCTLVVPYVVPSRTVITMITTIVKIKVYKKYEKYI